MEAIVGPTDPEDPFSEEGDPTDAVIRLFFETVAKTDSVIENRLRDDHGPKIGFILSDVVREGPGASKTLVRIWQMMLWVEESSLFAALPSMGPIFAKAAAAAGVQEVGAIDMPSGAVLLLVHQDQQRGSP